MFSISLQYTKPKKTLILMILKMYIFLMILLLLLRKKRVTPSWLCLQKLYFNTLFWCGKRNVSFCPSTAVMLFLFFGHPRFKEGLPSVCIWYTYLLHSDCSTSRFVVSGVKTEPGSHSIHARAANTFPIRS